MDGELLYNCIRLPAEWPPRGLEERAGEPPPVPYLQAPLAVVPIDGGRRLFVDEFLIAESTLRRTFHQPAPYGGNPVLQPATALELNGGEQPVACPFSDGVFYDPADRLFKLWYMAGWFDGTALALSNDGTHWQRPAFDVVPGTNRVPIPGMVFRALAAGRWRCVYQAILARAQTCACRAWRRATMASTCRHPTAAQQCRWRIVPSPSCSARHSMRRVPGQGRKPRGRRITQTRCGLNTDAGVGRWWAWSAANGQQRERRARRLWDRR